MSEPTNQQTTTDPKEQQTTTEPPKVDMIEKTKYDTVLQESMDRKQKIRDLESKVQELSTLASKAQGTEDLQKQLQTLTADLTRERQLGELKDHLIGMGALDPRVAELAYKDAEKRGVLGSNQELTTSFLSEWKQSNQTFFKPAEPERPVTHPAPLSQTPKVELPPAEMTPEEEYQAYKKLPPDERRKLGYGTAQKMTKIAGKLAADAIRG